MKVLLVGNYEADGQRSMDRFCTMLLKGLREAGIQAEVVRPAVVAGGRNKWLGYIDKLLLSPLTLRRAVKMRPGWVVHVVDQGNGIYAGWIRGCVVTCHDLLAIRMARGEFAGRRTGLSGRVFQWLILRGLRRAAGIASVSGATRRDVERLIGKSEVIADGVVDYWEPMEAEEAWERIEEAGVRAREAGYVLHVGGGQWYKNRTGVVRGFIELRKRTAHAPKLVIVGLELDGGLDTELKRAGLGDEVMILKDIADETLRALYAMARVFIFPSLEEGFGWPILEAQACGCPVVTTGKEPMTETGGAAAIYANAGEWTQAVAGVLEMNETRRAAVVAAGRENAQRFSAKKMVGKYIEFYRRHQ